MLVFHPDLRDDCAIISGQMMPFAPVLLFIFIHYALSPFHNKLRCKEDKKTWWGKKKPKPSKKHVGCYDSYKDSSVGNPMLRNPMTGATT